MTLLAETQNDESCGFSSSLIGEWMYSLEKNIGTHESVKSFHFREDYWVENSCRDFTVNVLQYSLQQSPAENKVFRLGFI